MGGLDQNLPPPAPPSPQNVARVMNDVTTSYPKKSVSSATSEGVTLPQEHTDEASEEAVPAPQPARRKRGRKAKPLVDLDSITDEKERKRQRRLMKNRMTAAMSRERRKNQFTELEESVSRLAKEKQELLAALRDRDAELAALRNRLAQAEGAAAPPLGGSFPDLALPLCL